MMQHDQSNVQKLMEKEIEMMAKKYDAKLSQETPKPKSSGLEERMMTVEEAYKKKLRMLVNKQFFELGKYLSNLYTDQ